MVVSAGLHKSQTNAKKKGKRSITVVGKAPEQFGKKWLIQCTRNPSVQETVPMKSRCHGWYPALASVPHRVFKE